jgi:hypothetical protein
MRILPPLLISIAICTSGWAQLPCEHVDIKVHGVTYTVPVGNNARKNDLYYLKKALKGDEDARDVFLGGEKERWFGIGEETPLWIKVTKDDEEVVKP